MTVVFENNLRVVRNVSGALELLNLLGYDASQPKYADAEGFGLPGGEARFIRSGLKRREGYGVLIAETDNIPRSLRRFGRLLVENLHDAPLAILGSRNGRGWEEWAVVRPRLVAGAGDAVSVAKLRVDPRAPTRHDLNVVRGLAWDPRRSDEENRKAIDTTLDVEAVTRAFFKGLNVHHGKLVDALRKLARELPAVDVGLRQVDPKEGPERVGLRILTQTLFCYFLQRRGLLRGESHWLSSAYKTAVRENRQFYPEVMEVLFYEWLNTPIEHRTDGQAGAGIPFLNGGLFERRYGSVSLPLPNDLFSTDDGLLGFLDGWSFTVSEDTADETEVAVDPEMLGKVFENLLAEDKKKTEGTVYTPRPVVQFMCREALVPWLQRQVNIDEPTARNLVAGEDPFGSVAADRGAEEAVRIARATDEALEDIRVLDPAVGSGAFLLGTLTEILRLRRLAHFAISGEEPPPDRIETWKLRAIEHNLFGVDINPTAIELCRLRLWLSLLVDSPSGAVRALPNLEYRTLCADSLTDFLGGVEVQRTERLHEPPRGQRLAFDLPDPERLVAARDRFFESSDPSVKRELLSELAVLEDSVVADIFAKVKSEAQDRQRSRVKASQRLAEQMLQGLRPLEDDFGGRDRIYPLFVPAFHAPDVAQRGGWDVVVMNPPYVGRRQAKRRLSELRLLDMECHYGVRHDLMIHFGQRALELLRPGGTMAVIFSDTVLTSIDGDEFRWRLTSPAHRRVTLHALARTRCFEGVAVNGSVIVASVGADEDESVEWVENHGRPTADLIGVSSLTRRDGRPITVGRTEVLVTAPKTYRRLPHRPLFRPNPAALRALQVYERCAGWDDFNRLLLGRNASTNAAADWDMFSEARRLANWRESAARRGFYEALEPGRDFVLLGCVVEGGMGIQTGDDRRFLAVIDGTPEAGRARARQEEFAAALEPGSSARNVYDEALRAGASREEALLAASEGRTEVELGWPRTGGFRIVDRDQVRTARPSPQEIKHGISEGPHFLPFEKGDSSGDDGGGAMWSRTNPVVIDWSSPSVELLRKRAAQRSTTRKALLTNEAIWAAGGVTWNAVASFLRARLMPEGAMFGHMAPLLRPVVPWLTTHALLALLNAPVNDFILRTFLGSRMHVEVMDVRRLPIPVLDERNTAALDGLGRDAVAARRQTPESGRSELARLEADLRRHTNEMYGMRPDEDFWVVR